MHVAFLATSCLVPNIFTLVAARYTLSLSAHSSVLGVHGLAGLHFMAASKRSSFPALHLAEAVRVS